MKLTCCLTFGLLVLAAGAVVNGCDFAASASSGDEAEPLEKAAAPLAPSDNEPAYWEYARYLDRRGEVVEPVAPSWFPALAEALAREDIDTGPKRYAAETGSRIPAFFARKFRFSEGLLAYESGGQCFYVDVHGKVLAGGFLSGLPFSEGLAAVLTVVDKGAADLRWGYIDKTGKFALPPVYSFARSFHEGRAAVEADGQMGYIDVNGKWSLPPQFKHATDFSEGVAGVVSGDLPEERFCGFIDHGGNRVVELPEGAVILGPFGEGLAPVSLRRARETQEAGADRKETRKLVYVDKAGRTVLELDFDHGEPFSQGRAAVARGSVWGVIDRTGRPIVPMQYTAVESFSNEWIIVHR